MLSLHELSTLLLIHSTPEQIDLTRTELSTLLAHRLVALKPSGGSLSLPALTAAGRRLLEAVAHPLGNRYADALSGHDAAR
ncbi:hypothetical protein [Burkholderia sp. Ac-20379]|uniref:hypothetical protein n=1 Tax=Burkholderia sp. Ac-20379 TaxID=2703900 RepID=UPI00197F181E|nr:hypothetical protein [Burkholderia sp. Ac-20379]MBN3724987.1 hypothetical protein [Burkholderia sp. Ac-20379]